MIKNICISIVIPAYNVEKYISEAIQSVLNQTFQDYEIIIINDASTDKTLEIARSFQDSRIRVYSNETNNDAAASRNQGIKLAKGEFISFLDADDLWTPDKLKLQLEALEDHPEAAVAYSWVDFIDEEGRWLYKGCRDTPSGKVYDKLLVRNFLDCGSNALYRKNTFDTIGYFDESLMRHDDLDLWIRISKIFNFVVVRNTQILYRQRKGLSSDIVINEKTWINCLNKAFREAPLKYRHLKKLSFAVNYSILSLVAVRYDRKDRAFLYLFRSFMASKNIIFNKLFWSAIYTALIRLFVSEKNFHKARLFILNCSNSGLKRSNHN